MSAGVTTFGFNCKLYIELTPGNPTEIGIVRDATLELGMVEVDASLRESGGFEITETALAQVAVNATIEWRNGNAMCELLYDRFLARTPVYLRVLTGPEDNADARGMKGSFSITKFPTAQELKDLANVQVVFKPARSALLSFYIQPDEGVEPVAAQLPDDADEIEQQEEPTVDG